MIREYIFTSWEKTCKLYAFEKFDAPLFEHLELYTQKSGEEIEKQLYTFEDKSGRRLALRPEMTPSLARMVATKGTALKRPIRWYSIPRLFRYEKMQKGRLREFFQLNVDILGITEVTADAELIAIAIDSMRNLGLDNSDFSVHISSRNVLEELFLFSGVDRTRLPELYAVLDKKNKISSEVFIQMINDCLIEKKVIDKVMTILSANNLEELRTIHPDSTSINDLEKLFSILACYNKQEYIQFDIGIVRGLAYYTGIVFELHDKKRALRAIAGGGRYDKLVGLYGGLETPAAGFAIGDVVLTELLKEKMLLPPVHNRSDVYIISFDKENITKVITLSQKLRDKNICCEFSLKPVAINKQMKLADEARARIVLFTGGDEEKEGKIKIRDMKTGKEILVNTDDIIITIEKILQNSHS